MAMDPEASGGEGSQLASPEATDWRASRAGDHHFVYTMIGIGSPAAKQQQGALLERV